MARPARPSAAALSPATLAPGVAQVRKTTKYWVQTKDVLKVKMFILKHRPVYKFTDGPSDSDLVTSIYYDNDKLELYQGRLKKYDGAIAFRIRWCAASPRSWPASPARRS